MVQFLKDFLLNFQAERNQYFLWVPTLIGAGITLFFSFDYYPNIYALIAVLIALCAAYFLNSKNGFRLIIAMIFFIIVGYSSILIRTVFLDTAILDRPYQNVFIEGFVEAIENKASKTRITLSIQSIKAKSVSLPIKKIRLTDYLYFQDLKIGDFISLKADIFPPQSQIYPESFNFLRYSYYKGIGAVGIIKGRYYQVGSTDYDFLTFVTLKRQQILNDIVTKIDQPTAGVLAALMVGDRSMIDERTLDAIRKSGLAHLLSISGLHVGMVAGLVFLFFRYAFSLSYKVSLKYPIKKWSACLTIIILFFYILMVGATIPTQRAFIMVTIMLLACLFDRSALSLKNLSIAAIIILVVKPESLLSPAFQMSFIAVLALIAFYEKRGVRSINYHDSLIQKLAFYFMAICLTSLIATIVTAPISAFHFNKIQIYSLFSNLLAIPLMGFLIMPSIIVAFVLYPFSMGEGGYYLAEKAIDIMLSLANNIASWPQSVLYVEHIPLTAFIFILIAIFCFCLFKTAFRFMCLIPLSLSFIIVFSYKQPDIYISPDGIALRNNQGKLIFTSDRKSYSQKIWLQKNAQTKPYYSKNNREDNGVLCNRYDCSYKKEIRINYIGPYDKNICIGEDIVILNNIIGKCAIQSSKMLEFNKENAYISYNRKHKKFKLYRLD